jgi:prepilin-type N-terminal cleavage/methylation domain-containing protein
MKNRAFTLLELLVVITIIGILASIVVVSMSGSTDSATIAKGKAYAQQVHALLGHEAVLDLNFNENAYNTCSDGKDVCDASGYRNNGTIYNNGATFVPSPIDGYALSFDGSDDYVTNLTTSNEIFYKGFTISLWLKPSQIGLGKGLISKATGSAAENGFILLQSGSFPQQIALNLNVGGWKYSGNFLNQDNWFHIVALVEAGNPNALISFYANAILSGTARQNLGMPLSAISTSNPLEIGRRYNSAVFFGLIDDIRIYSEVLPMTEIQKHYVQGLGKLMANQSITQVEYDQRMAEFNQSLVLHE